MKLQLECSLHRLFLDFWLSGFSFSRMSLGIIYYGLQWQLFIHRLTGAEGLVPHISAWHGFSYAPLQMTIGVVIVGVLLYLFLRYWRGIYSIAPMRWSLDGLYNGIIDTDGKGSHGV